MSNSNSTEPKPKNEKGDIANASSSWTYFIILTTIYVVVKLNATDGGNTQYLLIYTLLLIIGQFFINRSVANKICGNDNVMLALTVTAIPWVVVYALLNLMLAAFPGWKAPFSNTIGYMFARMSGLTELMDKIIKKPGEMGGEQKSQMLEAIDNIYSDKSLFINEITPQNFGKVWGEMRGKGGIFKQNIADLDGNKEKLEYYVRMKDIISEYIWMLLSGTLVTSISYNYIVNSKCQESIQEMNRRQAVLQAEAEKKEENDAKNPPQSYEAWDPNES